MKKFNNRKNNNYKWTIMAMTIKGNNPSKMKCSILIIFKENKVNKIRLKFKEK